MLLLSVCFLYLPESKLFTTLLILYSAHLQSEAQQVLYIDRSCVELIKEEGHEGCGLFPDGFFGDILGKKNYDSIQVRHIGPKLGLAKGVCCCLYLVSSRQILVFLTIFSIDHVTNQRNAFEEARDYSHHVAIEYDQSATISSVR